uniref:ribosomal protein L4 n=1 Tax=Glaucosphaera vacuolata TaxID=38265 RepID=UPI001FCD6412|nr:ribosomal protein L4 [Glaucosphaera vacuolata]UNJ18737.1 ribosomal protein L4 [Glaucosphaera vacuolata]
MTVKTHLEYPVYTWTGMVDKQIVLDCKIEQQNSSHIVHRALIKQMANQRNGTASTKTRSEVRGGGKKPWKQKGTGKARAGSIRSPLWRGGGVIFGPKLRSYRKKINRKEWRLALFTALYYKRHNTTIVENFDPIFKVPKTSLFINNLSNWNIPKDHKILIIIDKKNDHNINVYLSVRNLPKVNIINANNLNIIDILAAENLIITLDALKTIKEVYNEY